ncbi:MAG: hypothetical protein HQ503_12935 [Rhodospirillales bacterium]|nr:hypothetical protein [Rhodospirillales bacterium]
MGQNISISKAAKILGIKPSVLSNRLLAAGVPTFEGKADYEKVKCIAPTLNIGDIAQDRQRLIRENLLKPLSSGNTDLTRQELQDKVQRLTSDLAVEVQTSDSYLEVIKEMADRLGELQLSEDGVRQEMAFELCEWLRNKVIED